MRTWIKDPLAIFAEGAARGLVIEGTRISERVGQGETPERIDAVFDASGHVVLPGLVNAHTHLELSDALPDRFERQVAFLAGHAECGVLGGQV